MLRKMWLMGLMTVLVFTVAACGGESQVAEKGEPPDNTEDGGQLVIVDWGGAITEARQKTIFEPFEKEYNAQVIVESPTDYGKFKAMVESGQVTWDVVNVDTFWAVQAGGEGLLEPIDYSIVDADGIIPELATDYSVGAELYSIVIAYNTDEFSEDDHPKTWADFWDVDKFPGSRGLNNSPEETLELALLADGVSPDDLYPLDVDRAFASLNKLKSRTKIVWWDAGAQPPELLSNGTVAVSSAWNGRITSAKSQGLPVDLEYNQAILPSESWVVPKGSKHKELAMKFIDFATRAEIQAEFSKTIDYSPVNQQAIDMLPEEVQKRLGQSPEKAKTQVLRDEKWWVEHYEEINQRFQEWLLE